MTTDDFGSALADTITTLETDAKDTADEVVTFGRDEATRIHARIDELAGKVETLWDSLKDVIAYHGHRNGNAPAPEPERPGA